MTEYPLFVVDAFTSHAYEGNPCAVVFDADDLSSEQMQCMAREMNLSETAFVLSSSRAAFRVRYFTPRHEVPFAGHPTIATVYAMASQGRLATIAPKGEIDIQFEIGILPVRIVRAGDRIHRIVMTQPAPIYGATADVGALAEALQMAAGKLLPLSPPQVAGVGVPFLMIGIQDRETLLSVRPDWDRLDEVCRATEASAAYLYAPGGSTSDINLCSRFLDPFARYEDPFTGSACGAMAALAKRNGLIDCAFVRVEQGEAVGRIGHADIDLHEVGKRLYVGGEATLVAAGKIVPPVGNAHGNMDLGGST